ncbi:MAG: barstar family protein [Nitrospira sp.]|nr:barstar family protein [Nitrospira sp.]
MSRTMLPAYLQSTHAPWSSLLVVGAGQRAESLVHVPVGYLLRIVRGAKCRTTDGLLTEFARALDFPDYFGHNWDALEECLADLEWLPAKGYVVLITDAIQVLPDDEDEYETFLEILSDAGEAWGSGQAGMGAQRATPFHVLFAVSERERARRGHWGISTINADLPEK